MTELSKTLARLRSNPYEKNTYKEEQESGFSELILIAARKHRFSAVSRLDDEARKAAVSILIRTMHDCRGTYESFEQAKFLQAYRSSGFMKAIEGDNKNKKNRITLDHVVPVSFLVETIIRKSDNSDHLSKCHVDEILKCSILCAMTDAEHETLKAAEFNPDDIWSHYRKRNISVFDASAGVEGGEFPLLDLNDAHWKSIFFEPLFQYNQVNS